MVSYGCCVVLHMLGVHDIQILGIDHFGKQAGPANKTQREHVMKTVIQNKSPEISILNIKQSLSPRRDRSDDITWVICSGISKQNILFPHCDYYTDLCE